MTSRNSITENRGGNTPLLKLVLPVVIIWGCNFAVMRFGVSEVGPFTLAALRFLIAAVPLVFFVRRPTVPFLFIMAYAATFGLGQFGFLFVGIHLGLSSGLASLLEQLQVVFTAVFALLVLKQKISRATLSAIGVSLIGLLFIFLGSGEGAGAVVPILLGVAAALSWGASNVVIAWGGSREYQYNPVALVIWASALLPVPFAGAAFATGELATVTVSDLLFALLAAFYLGAMATVVAYNLWVKALSSYPAATVAPFSLLVPILGLALGWLVFGETLTAAEALGCGLVIVGVVLHMLGLRMRATRLT